MKGVFTVSVTREVKKAEAIARMKMWGIFPETIKQFEVDGKVSESAPPFGACFWLDDEQLARVRQFERDYNALVYHVVHSYTEFGELENYLYVSDYEEEWQMDRDALKAGEQCVYVFNKDAEFCSEFGTVGLELAPAAGLRRTW